MIRRSLILASLLPAMALAQTPYHGPRIGRTGQPGVIRYDGDAAADVISLRFKGARCDGALHTLASLGYTLSSAQAVFGSRVTSLSQGVDSLAWDAAMDEVRGNSTGTTSADFTVQKYAKVVGGSGTCVIDSTIDATLIKSRGVHIDFGGTVLVGQTSGTPVVDFSADIGVVVNGLTITGSATNSPNIGFLSARPGGINGSTYNVFNQPEASGIFTLAAYFNLNAEDTTINQGYFAQGATGGYGVIEDGINHFGVCSANPAVGCLPANQTQSFNTFVCHECKIRTFGTNEVPIWQANTHSHTWEDVYINNKGTGNTPAIVKYFGSGAVSINDNFKDVHFEHLGNTGPVVMFTGAASITAPLFSFSDHVVQATPYVFVADTGVTSVALPGANIQIGQMGDPAALWYDQPAIYTISGLQFSGDGVGFNATNWTGQACTPACSLSGTGIGVPAVINVSQVVHAGPLAAINVTARGAFYRSATAFPTVTIAPPPAGANAAAHVVAFTLNSTGQYAGSGTGYTAGEVITDTSDTCSVPPIWKVTTVDVSGVPTGKPTLLNRGYCQAWVAGPVSVTGATGSGLTITGSNLGLAPGLTSIVVDNGAAGFPTPPAITFGGSAVLANRPVAKAVLTGNLLLTSGGASIALGPAGIGVNGPLMDAASGTTGFIQNLASSYQVGATYLAGGLLNNGGNTYQVTNLGCVSVDATGPVATSGAQTLDGCVYQFIQSGIVFSEETITDQGALFAQPVSLGVIGQPGISVQVSATTGSPNGLVTAPPGSLDLDQAEGSVWINQDGAATWRAASGTIRSTYANLPSLTSGISTVFCSDCRKPGEVVNSGTGMMVFTDNANWVSSAGTIAAH